MAAMLKGTKVARDPCRRALGVHRAPETPARHRQSAGFDVEACRFKTSFAPPATFADDDNHRVDAFAARASATSRARESIRARILRCRGVELAE
jgi:hypothetical protein